AVAVDIADGDGGRAEAQRVRHRGGLDERAVGGVDVAAKDGEAGDGRVRRLVEVRVGGDDVGVDVAADRVVGQGGDAVVHAVIRLGGEAGRAAARGARIEQHADEAALSPQAQGAVDGRKQDVGLAVPVHVRRDDVVDDLGRIG